MIIDLSHWQTDPIDWVAAKAAGVAAVILKATQGTDWIDPRFVARAGAAQCAGLLVGAYHFCDGSPPSSQVAHFERIARHLPLLAIDVEPNNLPGDTVSIVQAAEIAARLRIDTGRAPLIYIGRYGPTGTGAGLPNSVLSRCPLWLAEWTDTAILPAGWSYWTFWQYTNTGVVPGISGSVDLSRFHGGDLKTWWSNG